jgi:uncharacterized protein YecE (DUF72 family)
MKLHAGTSGFSYKEWKGSFYPADMKAAGMLAFYARHFDTVEINNTFYRMPTATLLEQWGAEVGPGFSFVLKAPQRITHQKRLAGAEEDTAFFFSTAARLGEKLGPALFQMPPHLKKDMGRLRGFLRTLPAGRRVALEFRHASWLDDEVLAALREVGAALCVADTDDDPVTMIHPTADWGYLRLRQVEYDAAALAAWVARIRAQPWQEVFVFFKHEDEGTGPRFAQDFKAIWGAPAALS